MQTGAERRLALPDDLTPLQSARKMKIHAASSDTTSCHLNVPNSSMPSDMPSTYRLAATTNAQSALTAHYSTCTAVTPGTVPTVMFTKNFRTCPKP